MALTRDERALLLNALLLIHVNYACCSRLIVIYADGFGGVDYHKYSRVCCLVHFHTALCSLQDISEVQQLESTGVWSDFVVGVFPTLKMPTLYSLLTGRLPTHHGFVADQFYSKAKDLYFLGGDLSTGKPREFFAELEDGRVQTSIHTGGNRASMPQHCGQKRMPPAPMSH